MSTQNKPWYKQWWGVILTILIWPLFLLWFTWARSKKNTPIKVLSTCGVLALLLIFIAALSGSNKPTTSLANLNSQAASILTVATKNTEQLMSTGQADASQSNALSTSPQSAFEKWRSTVEKTTDSNTDNAYKQAIALYTSAGKTIPSALTAWKKDNFTTYADIGVWQLAEVTVLVDNEGGSSSSSVQSDKTTLNTDYQAYQADLTKALTDISKLLGKPVATVPSASTTTTASTTSTQPTESLASLNAQAVADFNPILSDLTQQMSQGQSYATQSNAANASSTFH